MPASEPPLSVVEKYEALREFLPNLEEIGAEHDELDLLNEVLGDTEYQALGEVYDILSMDLPTAETGSVGPLVQDVLETINADSRPPKHAREMRDILLSEHIKAFLETYDDVVGKAYISDDNEDAEGSDKVSEKEEEENKENDRRSEERDTYEDKRDTDEDKRREHGSYSPPSPVYDQNRENSRFAILKKSGQEPLGITVRLDDYDNLYIAKIRQNSLADVQSDLKVGDFVKEANGIPVFTPEDMMAVLKDVEEWIIIKIVPQHNSSSDVLFLKACVNYNPMTDRLIPYKKLGLSYNTGDVLAVFDDKDENWWQARLADDPSGPVGLIPSRSLQEKRQVLVQPETTKAKSSLLCGMGKKKKKVGYDSANAGEYEDGHVKIYEEVELSGKFRCSLALIGVDKEAKRALKERLVRDFPDKYATPVPDTSRPMKPKDKQGKGFVFRDPEEMKEDLKRNLYIEDGEYNGHMYGLQVSAIRDMAHSGKICVLDVAPQYLKFLMAPEFRPLVVFIAAPRWESLRNKNRNRRRINNNRDEDDSDDMTEEKCRELEKESREMQDRFRRNFDEVIVNDNQEHTFQNLVAFLQDVTSRAEKWVPKGSERKD